MKEDKIIQILMNGTKILGLSDSGKLYERSGDKWSLLIQSPERDKNEAKAIKS